VAFGLGVQHLRVDESIAMFKTLSKRAFTKRKGVGLPGVGRIVEAHNHSIYQTRGLIDALQGVFGDIPLFGVTDQSELQIKVGVTTTSSNHNAYLMANYNRPELDRCNSPTRS